MALAFNQVPDWTSWQNQGANVAVADLDKDGVPELIVFADGSTLDPIQGIGSAKSWTSTEVSPKDRGPDPIPNSGSYENQGAGVAVADFGAARPGLVVFQVHCVVPGIFVLAAKLTRREMSQAACGSVGFARERNVTDAV
jgi:FG-GAP repeat